MNVYIQVLWIHVYYIRGVHTHTHTHTHMHANMYAYAATYTIGVFQLTHGGQGIPAIKDLLIFCTNKHTCIHTYIHTYILIYSNSYNYIYIYIYTVKPPNSDHVGDRTFGLFSEVGPFSEVLL